MQTTFIRKFLFTFVFASTVHMAQASSTKVAKPLPHPMPGYMENKAKANKAKAEADAKKKPSEKWLEANPNANKVAAACYTEKFFKNGISMRVNEKHFLASLSKEFSGKGILFNSKSADTLKDNWTTDQAFKNAVIDAGLKMKADKKTAQSFFFPEQDGTAPSIVETLANASPSCNYTDKKDKIVCDYEFPGDVGFTFVKGSVDNQVIPSVTSKIRIVIALTKFLKNLDTPSNNKLLPCFVVTAFPVQ